MEIARNVPGHGRLDWIGCAPARLGPVAALDAADLVADLGIVGDHHARAGSERQVTLIQAEHLEAIRRLLPDRPPSVAPETCRRNLVVSGINLLALRTLRFSVGDVVLMGTGPCPPCSRMERALGRGGYQAMRGHGGITARVLQGGRIRIGDRVRAVSPQA